MLSVTEALALILESVSPFEAEPVELGGSLGLVLATDVASDLDSPPFDKALMDGVAVRAADLPDGTAELRIIEEVTAGEVPTKPVGPGEATRIMTGAPLPPGADAVVRIEECEIDEPGRSVRIVAPPLKPGMNVMLQGAALRRGENVLSAGRLLRPQEIAALAELGQATVQVRRRPRVAVLATGNELVPIEQKPGPGQIRNSNEAMLAAQVKRAGGTPVPLGIARDDRPHLAEGIRRGLQCDVLLLSGGVSAGKLDLVPSELEEGRVRQVFHKVDVKPGKPVWYGVYGGEGGEAAPDTGRGGSLGERSSLTPPGPPLSRGGERCCHVFGLPGNPVSSMVCFELFVRPALRRMMGFEPAVPQVVRAKLGADHVARSDRPTYHPARLAWGESGAVIHVVEWLGSADLRATIDANAMVIFAAGEQRYRTGDAVEVIAWD